jgi:hypothetical protein
MAVGHSILVIAWHLLANDCDYQDLGGDFFVRRDADRARPASRRPTPGPRLPRHPRTTCRLTPGGFTFQDEVINGEPLEDVGGRPRGLPRRQKQAVGSWLGHPWDTAHRTVAVTNGFLRLAQP